MFDHHIEVIESSVSEARRRVGIKALSVPLLKRLFETFPETADMFDIESLEGFAPEKFQYVLDLIVDTLKRPEYARESVENEIVRHQMYALKDEEYYFVLVESVPECVKSVLADDWTDEMEECWSDAVYGLKGFIHESVAELGL
ncbi:Uncharacterised protein [BD1-7 clade bacterium]|uniref:Globin family profile domain-containing protein n=1 Tax=BD1-7 clade bacterium TaxID=2029982 RepID=A0A5S9QX08_9GAMM|nr:Uncharacterised protein [BD1-7 clade bacterium]CAA0096153.1 Uncharacterised protein [BD1-7 clade bacterium]CAA0123810.1 Uncharacterised protein [BD1-7 clade bacterium]